MPEQQLKGCVALITGGGSGFGRAAALKFCAEGARVAIGDLNRDSAQETAQQVRDAGGEALALKVDVADEASVGQFFGRVIEHYGRIDCAFNNAGLLGPVGDLHAVALADYAAMVAVNDPNVVLHVLPFPWPDIVCALPEPCVRATIQRLHPAKSRHPGIIAVERL